MKTYRTVLLTLIAIGGLAALAPLANAQENAPKGRPGRPGMPGGGSIQERVKQMTEQLNLTDEQKEKFKAAFQEQEEKMRALREDQNLSPEEKRTKIRELLEARLKPILTPEQQGKWQKLRAQGGGLGEQQMAKELNLTDEQKEKFNTVSADQAEKLKELRENQNLSREEKMAKLREMNEGIEAKLKPILTPEQFEKWQKVRPQPGAPRRRPAGDN